MPITIPVLTSLGVMPYCVLGLMVMAEGPIATLLGGAATSSGALLPLPVYCSVVIGNLTADLGWYSLGRFCQPRWLIRLAPRLRVDPGKVAALQEGIQKNAPRLLFFSKLTVGLPIPALLATGISRVPVRRWGFWLVLGELIKSAVLVSVGYLYAQAVQQASTGVQMVLWAATAAVLLAGAIAWRLHRRKANP